MEARVDCYGRIISAVKLEFDRWLHKHPEYAGDERNRLALRESILGLAMVFDILEDYEIVHRDEMPGAAPGIGMPIGEIMDIMRRGRGS
jgi:hypothetical protein